jgi:glycosyltransferase involved in cell wall biosynthesis
MTGVARPRVLFISNVVPWPADTGIKLRIYHLLRAVAREGDVTLVCFSDGTEREDPASLESHVERVILVPRDSCEYRTLEGLSRPRRIARTVHESFDVAWVESVGLVPLLDHFPAARRIVDLADLEHRKLAHRLRQAIWDRLLPVDCLEFLKLRRFERSLPRRVDNVVVCSDVDRRALGDARNVRVVPNGVTVPSGSPLVRRPHQAPVLLFVGTLGYAPNVDAMQYFCARVMPLIRRDVPDVRLDIVGADPPAAIRALHDGERIRVTGRVPSVEPYLMAADAAVVPIRWGGGSRIKILEALAHKLPVVTTTVGAEGLDVEPGRHVLMADRPEAIAAACVAILRDGALRERLTREGYDLVAATYDWSQIGRGVQALVRVPAQGSLADVAP